MQLHKEEYKCSVYVYHVGKGYRNKKGQPTSDQILIGRLDESSGRLTPNDTYFQFYDEKPQENTLKIDSIKNFGNYFLLNELVIENKLDIFLKNAFGDDSDEIIALAIYMTLEGNILSNSVDFFEETLTSLNYVITPSEISRLLKRISKDKQDKFFRAWIKERLENEYLAYDVTSISSYSSNNEDVEFGYNRDKENLPQVNVGMFYGATSHLPVYYSNYYGSITDKTHLKTIIRNASKLGITNAMLVMDRGFFSIANLKYLENMTQKFIIEMSNCTKLGKYLINTYGTETKKYTNSIEIEDLTAFRVHRDDYGFDSVIHIFYSDTKAASERLAFKEDLRKWEAAISMGDDIPESSKTFFNIDAKSDPNTVKCTKNINNIEEHLNTMGYFLILTSDLARDSSDLIEIYRLKDVVEKAFDNIKNRIDMKRLHVHSAEAENGKLFLAFIALILRTCVFNAGKEYIRKNNLSVDSIFLELQKIKVVVEETGFCSHGPLTKKQKEILLLFKKSEETIDNTIKSIASLRTLR
ncbi:MAG: transposase [Christensenellaceae bacterium]|jgi:transposase|nr:transposase [Christensenellaceae bacterium]